MLKFIVDQVVEVVVIIMVQKYMSKPALLHGILK